MSYGPPGQAPPPGGYGPNPGYTRPPSPEPPKNYLVHNILGIIGCTIVGIIGLVFSLQVNNKWESGDYHGAQEASQVAKILGIIGLIGFCLVAGIVLIWLVFFVFIYGVLMTAY